MSLRPTAILLGFGLACLGFLPGCGPRPEQGTGAVASDSATADPVTAVVLVSIDTLRADRLPAWGYQDVATPHLDALRDESIRFVNAWSHIPLTLPSHASVMTGLLPAEHGVRDNVGYRMPEGPPTLAELLQQAGWKTAAAVSAAPLHSRTGFDKGFDVYEDKLEAEVGTGLGEVLRTGFATLDAIRPWLRSTTDLRTDQSADQRTDNKVFLFFHLFEPHTPYDPPAEFAERYGNTYDAEVAAADAVFGELRAELEKRGLWQNAAIVVFSDHGEGLGDHGEEEHGVLLYREALHVPLFIKLPGGRHGNTTVDDNVQLTDIFPTVLSLAGLPDPRPAADSALSGRTLVDADGNLVKSKPSDGKRAVVAETFYPRIHFGWSELLSVVQGDHHYIEGATSELYDLASDPNETQDLRVTKRREAAALKEELAAYDVAWQAPSALDEEQRAQLAALGYLSSSVPETEGDRPDPKSQLHVLQALREGATAYRDQNYEQAVALLEPLLADHPQMADGWTVLGHSLNNLGRKDDALHAYLRVLELTPSAPGVAAPAATLLAQDGQPRAAVDLLRGQIEKAPSSSRLRRLEVRLLVQMEALEEALQRLDDWLDHEPDDVEALYQRGIVHMLRGDVSAADADLRTCIGLAPEYAPALHDLGVLLLQGGRVEEARALVQRALESDPEHPLARRTLERIERVLAAGR